MTIYGSLEQFGLEILDEMDDPEANYSFDMIVLFRDVATRELFMATDSGCSCPAPFEDLERGDLMPIHTIDELQRCLDAFPWDVAEKRDMLAKARIALAEAVVSAWHGARRYREEPAQSPQPQRRDDPRHPQARQPPQIETVGEADSPGVPRMTQVWTADSGSYERDTQWCVAASLDAAIRYVKNLFGDANGYVVAWGDLVWIRDDGRRPSDIPTDRARMSAEFAAVAGKSIAYVETFEFSALALQE